MPFSAHADTPPASDPSQSAAGDIELGREESTVGDLPLSDTFKYSKGWVTPPKPQDLQKDIPAPVDDDYSPFDPLPLPDLDAPPLPGERRSGPTQGNNKEPNR